MNNVGKAFWDKRHSVKIVINGYGMEALYEVY